jgi:hypothetical protein
MTGVRAGMVNSWTGSLLLSTPWASQPIARIWSSTSGG